MKLHLVMPMGGGGTRFGNHGFEVPKPLIEINGKPFFFWATQSIIKYVDVASLTFVVLKDHVERFSIDKKIQEVYPYAKIRVIPEVLPGAVMTCLAGIDDLPDEEPILFNDCDHMFLCKSFYDFCREERFAEIDGGLLTFRANDPRFSYVSYDEEGYVNRTVEKEVIGEDAICGAYYFQNRACFKDATERYFETCSYKEFFLSGVYNEMINIGLKIKTFRTDEHVSFGTPEEYDAAKVGPQDCFNCL